MPAPSLPPHTLFARDFADGFLLCYTDGTGEFNLFEGGQQGRVRVLPTSHKTLAVLYSYYVLTPDDESNVLRKLASEAINFSPDDKRTRNRILVGLKNMDVFINMYSYRPTLIDFCFAYREIVDIRSRRGVSP